MLRIGCVKYLNARPLIRGWQGSVEFDHPATLCKRLADGGLDVALVSSFEFLRNPIYRIVDDVSISSDGPVYSVVVAHQGELSEVKEIELDPASATAVNLLRCLLSELGFSPRLIEAVQGSTGCQPVVSGSSLSDTKARLLIGDQAIRFRETFASDCHFWDLGEQWRKLVDLPFVYALWLIRPEVNDPKQIADRLRALCDENLTKLDNLISQTTDFDRDFCRRYYRENLCFKFDESAKEGLRTFASLCARHALLPKRDLAFDVV